MSTKPLWTPNTQEIASSRLTDFSEYVSGKFSLTLTNYEALHAWSIDEPELFWSALWDYFDVIGTKGESVVSNLDLMPGAVWFPNATLNFAENLLRYAQTSPDAIALNVHNETGLRIRITYGSLYDRVAALANTLKRYGIEKGDRVAAITTNSEHAVIGMLATASIGAVWSSCSPDFGESGILDRFSQIQPKVLIACTQYIYAGKQLDCEAKINSICAELTDLNAVVLFDSVDRTSTEHVSGISQPQLSWQRATTQNDSDSGALNFEPMAFNDPLYILFSSGTTGKPKCIVHGIGGTLLQHLKELALHTDVTEGTKLFYFTTCGWMMWNWYVSALGLGASLVVYDGSPFHPRHPALFDLAETEMIEVFGVSAKFFAAAEKFGLKPKETHQLASIKSILSTGSPLVPESFDYLYRDVAPEARVSSISGGTDIVSCFALGVPTLPVFRGELQSPGLGMNVQFVDDEGASLETGKGELICKTSFPSMPIYFWGDKEGSRYHQAYFARFENTWAHGDFGEFHLHALEDGSVQHGVMIHGRSDAVLNPNGVRIGTAEIYRQVEQVEEVFESLAIGQKWDGDERIVLFVRLINNAQLDTNLSDQIKQQIRSNTSPRHVPAKIIAVDDIPRTRSGKIVELAVRSIVHGEPVKNTEALANPEALELFKDLTALRT